MNTIVTTVITATIVDSAACNNVNICTVCHIKIIVNQIGSQIEEIIKDYKPGDEVPKLEVPEVDNEVTVPTDELGSVVFPSMTTESVMPGDGVELG